MILDRKDVQGVVLNGYHYDFARLLLLSFPDEARGKQFLRWVLPRITDGTRWDGNTKPEPLYNLGLTFNGLRAVGLQAIFRSIDPKLALDDSLANPFPLEFCSPPNEVDLGDVAPEDRRANWWNKQGDDAVYPRLHAMLQVYARSSMSVLDKAVDEARAQARALGIDEVVQGPDGLPPGGQSLPGDRVHFGYVDGISQPAVDWENDKPARGMVDRRYFLLGDPSLDVPSSPGPAAAGNLFRNGCYMAFRWIAQDVPAFEDFLDRNADSVRLPGMSTADARELLAAKLVGRWRSGAPLVLSPDRDDPSLSDRNDFRYNNTDPNGLICPFSSHIRIANSRDQPLDSVVVRKVPPLLRRGLSYGAEWVRGVNDSEDRGLLGMFLCSSLKRQFQLLVKWMNRNDFSPVFSGDSPPRHDPLFGSRLDDPRPLFRVSVQGKPVDIPLPRSFLNTRGTAYFLLPGLSTLQRLSS